MGTFFGFVTLLLLALMAVILVNPSLARNRKTGEVPSRKRIAAGLGVLAFASFAIAIGTTDDTAPKLAAATPAPTPKPPPKAVTVADNKIKPESIVMFPKGQAACLTKDALEEFFVLAATHKATKANALFANGDDGPQCIMLSPTTRYKVIDAEYNDPSLPEAAILEVVGEDVKAAEGGAFALIVDNSMVKILKRP
jgi:hypothetical protein